MIRKKKNQLAQLKKIRNDWGGVKPISRIKTSAKLYDRKKNKPDTDE